MTSWALIVYPARCDNWINALDNDCSAMWSDSISQIEEPWMFWQHQHDSSEPRVNNYRLPPVQVCPPVTSTLWTRWSQTNCQQPLWPPKIILTKKLDAWFQFRAAAECFEVERDKAGKWRRRNTLCMSRTTFGKSSSSSVNSHPFKVFSN